MKATDPLPVHWIRVHEVGQGDGCWCIEDAGRDICNTVSRAFAILAHAEAAVLLAIVVKGPLVHNEPVTPDSSMCHLTISTQGERATDITDKQLNLLIHWIRIGG